MIIITIMRTHEPGVAAFLLEIPEISIESLDES